MGDLFQCRMLRPFFVRLIVVNWAYGTQPVTIDLSRSRRAQPALRGWPRASAECGFRTIGRPFRAVSNSDGPKGLVLQFPVRLRPLDSISVRLNEHSTIFPAFEAPDAQSQGRNRI